MLYPVDGDYIFPAGFRPGEILQHGSWTQVADNVSLPIGDTIYINPYPTEHRITGYGVKFKRANSQTLKGIVNLGIDSSGILYTDGSNNMTGSDYITPAFANLYAELSTATNTQTVSIWERKED